MVASELTADSAPGARPGSTSRSLSPSRASDFKTCPLLYRLRSIDRLPEKPTQATARGTLVHAVLERLYDLPAEQRSTGAAEQMLQPQWERLAEAEPELAQLFSSPEELTGWLESARRLLTGYFELEDPRALQPAERELLVEADVTPDLRLRGYIDRVDIAPAGQIRIVDYKTGSSPSEAFEARALFQLKFYALVIWRTRGVVPAMLRLVYLGNSEVLDYAPEAEELARFEKTVIAIADAIAVAAAAADFRPKPSKLCGWCSHQALCPAFGGTPPPYPVPATTVSAETVG